MLTALLVFLVCCFGAAALGNTLTRHSVRTWYPALAKPAWTPPSATFAPVWTVLYATMAVAAWMVWQRGPSAAVTWALVAFFLQLGLNAAWSLIFFGLRRPRLAFLDIVLLWVTIGATVVLFARVRPAAAWLLLPYWAWVSFATLLNGVIWRMNR